MTYSNISNVRNEHFVMHHHLSLLKATEIIFYRNRLMIKILYKYVCRKLVEESDILKRDQAVFTEPG